jgi:hypothetical protein
MPREESDVFLRMIGAFNDGDVEAGARDTVDDRHPLVPVRAQPVGADEPRGLLHARHDLLVGHRQASFEVVDGDVPITACT